MYVACVETIIVPQQQTNRLFLNFINVEAKVTDLLQAAKETAVGGKVEFRLNSNPCYSLKVITSGSVNR